MGRLHNKEWFSKLGQRCESHRMTEASQGCNNGENLNQKEKWKQR